MKLNKFLVAAAAVAVLPLSVANAEEPTSSNGPAGTPVLQPEPAPTVEKPEFKGGVNGPELVQPELKPYGASVVAPEVHTKPEYKPSNGTFRVDKGTEAPKADQTKKVLPKTSAVK